MRSQLDGFDTRLPRKTFDIKTRAVVAVRQDILNYKAGAGYNIKKSRKCVLICHAQESNNH